ncbi:ATP-dependent chaperone protein ClpB [Escherichia coli]|uniref:ATP-dependent chaperone protein ClpB n=1 Tax=Escherichia coli TaxID=562 RepID=A0A376L1E2_ECOLX|nr:ATP-dependent chaperone protein ClpB [Escherichia coli]
MQYDETLTALDELEAAWHQQQTLVQEIIALRQQLLGMAEDDAASLPHRGCRGGYAARVRTG